MGQSVAMHGSLLRAAIAACIVATAYASCGTAEATKITDCQKALVSPTSSGDQLKKDTCTYVKEMMECFPKDCCTDKKADVDKILADHKANLEPSCDTDCGPHDEHDHGSEASAGSARAPRRSRCRARRLLSLGLGLDARPSRLVCSFWVQRLVSSLCYSLKCKCFK